jgi:hypothetical protein
MRPERTLKGVVSFDPSRRISPAGPGCKHELASQKQKIALIALSSIRRLIVAIPQKTQRQGARSTREWECTEKIKCARRVKAQLCSR